MSVGEIFQLQGVEGHSYEVLYTWTWPAGMLEMVGTRDGSTFADIQRLEWGFLLDLAEFGGDGALRDHGRRHPHPYLLDRATWPTTEGFQRFFTYLNLFMGFDARP